jgi:hypothetical protein
MAQSRCPRDECGGTSFELKELVPRKANFKYQAVQCANCGAVVSVVDTGHLPSILAKIASRVGINL